MKVDLDTFICHEASTLMLNKKTGDILRMKDNTTLTTINIVTPTKNTTSVSAVYFCVSRNGLYAAVTYQMSSAEKKINKLYVYSTKSGGIITIIDDITLKPSYFVCNDMYITFKLDEMHYADVLTGMYNADIKISDDDDKYEIVRTSNVDDIFYIFSASGDSSILTKITDLDNSETIAELTSCRPCFIDANGKLIVANTSPMSTVIIKNHNVVKNVVYVDSTQKNSQFITGMPIRISIKNLSATFDLFNTETHTFDASMTCDVLSNAIFVHNSYNYNVIVKNQNDKSEYEYIELKFTPTTTDESFEIVRPPDTPPTESVPYTFSVLEVVPSDIFNAIPKGDYNIEWIPQNVMYTVSSNNDNVAMKISFKPRDTDNFAKDKPFKYAFTKQ